MGYYTEQDLCAPVGDSEFPVDYGAQAAHRTSVAALC